MEQKNIYLIGMMGSGKSTIAKLLSQKINMDYIDMDNEIEELMDMSIEMIFLNYGEKRFRMIESSFFKEITKVKQIIYATGGGIVLDDSNRKIITKTGISIFLDCSINEIKNRITNSRNKRPLISNDINDIKDIYENRYSIYKDSSHFTIDTTSLNIEQVLEKTLKCIN